MSIVGDKGHFYPGRLYDSKPGERFQSQLEWIIGTCLPVLEDVGVCIAGEAQIMVNWLIKFLLLENRFWLILSNQSSAVVAGWEHTCATLRNGSIYCWGQGTWGQLGIGNIAQSNYGYPAPLSNSQTIKASLSERDFDGNSILNIFQTRENLDYKSRSLAAGGFHTCSIIENGSIACAGYNGDDQLGAGNGGVDQRTPILTKLANGVTATQVVAGYDYTCAILGNGSINCWGDNSLGQLGDGTFTDRTVPSYIPTSRDAIDIAAGSGRHTCAIFDNGSLYCWGYATDGQLGIGSTSSKNSPMFVNLGVGRTAVDISTGASHTCAILDNGSVKCWGDNSKGQLGDGTLSQRTTPTLVTNLGGNAISLSLGDRSLVLYWMMGLSSAGEEMTWPVGR